MRVIDLVQGTDQWLAWRALGVSATDSPVILGKSPYKTPWRLWAEKTGKTKAPDISGNPNVRRGNKLEPIARQWMEKHIGKILLPLCGEWSTNPIFRASFDGVTDGGTPVELKAPSEKTFEEVKKLQQESTAYKLYYYQVQHQLLVADAEAGYLVFFHEEQEPIFFMIQRDNALIDEMIKKGTEFWSMVQGHGEPKLDPEKDLFEPTTADQEKNWAAAAAVYRSAERTLKQIEAEAKMLKANMKEAEKVLTSIMGEFQKADHAGITVTRFTKTGSIDYKKFLTEKFPVDESQLETYRRKPSQCVRISSDPEYIDLNVKSNAEKADTTDAPVSAVGWF